MRVKMFENDFYKKIVGSSPIGYAYHKILCDEDGVPYDFEYVEVNKAFEEFTGLNRKNIIGKTISNVLPEILDSEFDWIACYGEVALSGTEKFFEQYSEPLNKWYRVNAFSPEKGYFVTNFVDITEHVEIKKELSDKEKHYRMLAENVADVVWTADLKLNATWVSPSIYQLTGETPEEHMATNIQDRFNQSDLMRINSLFQEQLLLEKDPNADKKRSVELEVKHRKKNGGHVWTSMKVTYHGASPKAFERKPQGYRQTERS